MNSHSTFAEEERAISIKFNPSMANESKQIKKLVLHIQNAHLTPFWKGLNNFVFLQLFYAHKLPSPHQYNIPFHNHTWHAVGIYACCELWISQSPRFSECVNHCMEQTPSPWPIEASSLLRPTSSLHCKHKTRKTKSIN